MLYIICYGVNNVLIMSSITYYATYVMGSTGAATIIQAVYPVSYTHLCDGLRESPGNRRAQL